MCSDNVCTKEIYEEGWTYSHTYIGIDVRTKLLWIVIIKCDHSSNRLIGVSISPPVAWF